MALGRFCGRPKASGLEVEIPFALVWTLRDGAAVRVDEYTDTALLIEALGSPLLTSTRGEAGFRSLMLC